MTEPKDHADEDYDLIEIRRTTYEMYQELDKVNHRCAILATVLGMVATASFVWASYLLAT